MLFSLPRYVILYFYYNDANKMKHKNKLHMKNASKNKFKIAFPKRLVELLLIILVTC